MFPEAKSETSKIVKGELAGVRFGESYSGRLKLDGRIRALVKTGVWWRPSGREDPGSGENWGLVAPE